MKYRLHIKNGKSKFATVYEGDKKIECLDGLLIDAIDHLQLEQIVKTANEADTLRAELAAERKRGEAMREALDSVTLPIQVIGYESFAAFTGFGVQTDKLNLIVATTQRIIKKRIIAVLDAAKGE